MLNSTYSVTKKLTCNDRNFLLKQNMCFEREHQLSVTRKGVSVRSRQIESYKLAAGRLCAQGPSENVLDLDTH